MFACHAFNTIILSPLLVVRFWFSWWRMSKQRFEIYAIIFSHEPPKSRVGLWTINFFSILGDFSRTSGLAFPVYFFQNGQSYWNCVLLSLKGLLQAVIKKTIEWIYVYRNTQMTFHTRKGKNTLQGWTEFTSLFAHNYQNRGIDMQIEVARLMSHLIMGRMQRISATIF